MKFQVKGPDIKTKPEPTASDLFNQAVYMRGLGYRGIFLFSGGPGVIRYSSHPPEGKRLVVYISDRGRIWLDTDATDEWDPAV